MSPYQERRCCDRKIPLKAVAEAAGIRLSVLKRYATCGVRGAGKLRIDGEGNVTISDIVYLRFLIIHQYQPKVVHQITGVFVVAPRQVATKARHSMRPVCRPVLPAEQVQLGVRVVQFCFQPVQALFRAAGPVSRQL